MNLELTSPAFRDGGAIPTRYTCDGADLSPPLDWVDPPEGTKSFALICDDPDAPMGTFVHWLLYDIPADRTTLREGIPADPVVKGIGAQGKNDFRKSGYGGPAPPHGKPHRYFFKLYALDSMSGLKPGAKKAELEKAMRGHLLATGGVMGTYQR